MKFINHASENLKVWEMFFFYFRNKYWNRIELSRKWFGNAPESEFIM